MFYTILYVSIAGRTATQNEDQTQAAAATTSLGNTSGVCAKPGIYPTIYYTLYTQIYICIIGNLTIHYFGLFQTSFLAYRKKIRISERKLGTDLRKTRFNFYKDTNAKRKENVSLYRNRSSYSS